MAAQKVRPADDERRPLRRRELRGLARQAGAVGRRPDRVRSDPNGGRRDDDERAGDDATSHRQPV
jgi:hypothetical protein